MWATTKAYNNSKLTSFLFLLHLNDQKVIITVILTPSLRYFILLHVKPALTTAFSCFENINKLTGRTLKIRQLRHEMKISGKNRVYPF